MSLFGSIMNKIFHHPATPAPPGRTRRQDASSAATFRLRCPRRPAQPPQPVDVDAVLTRWRKTKGGGGN